jgi:hypothetical protein
MGTVGRPVVVQPVEPAHPRPGDQRAEREAGDVGRLESLHRLPNEDFALGERSTLGQVLLLRAAPESLRVDVLVRR